MNKFLVYFVLLSLFAVSFPGCKNRKIPQPDKKPTVSDRVDALSKIEENRLQFHYLTLKGKGDVDSPKQSLGFTYKITIAKDSVIMGSFTKAGYEFIRFLVDQDSMYLRIVPEKRAIKCDFDFLTGLTGIRADYQYIQNLLTGDLIQVCETLTLAETETSEYKYEGTAGQAKVDYIISDQFFKLLKMTLRDESNAFDSQLLYGDFLPVNEQLMARSVSLLVNKDGKTEVGLSHSKVEIEPEKVSFNFRIPKSYKVEHCGEIKQE